MAEQASQQAVLTIENLTKIYRTAGGFFGGGGSEVVALKDVSLSVAKGEIFGLVGESGSGKTTCGRLVVALEKATAGSIKLNGQEISGLSPKDFKRFRQEVQMVFQDPYQSMNPQLTVLDSVAEPLITNRLCPPQEREGRVLDALRLVGLTPPEEYALRFPHQLSGGQRQRVAIARAMIVEPACLVADEPTSMLDASYSAQIFEMLLEFKERLGTAILFITHSLASARYLCDRIGVIFRGHMMEAGPAREVIGNPRHPYTQALLDATPKFGRGTRTPRYGTLLEAERNMGQHTGCAFYVRCKKGHPSTCTRETPPFVTVGLEHRAACLYPAAPAPGAAGENCLAPGL